MKKSEDSSLYLIIIGAVVGIGMALLAHFGNPGNMALCTICFIRDIAGSLGLHSAAVAQYFRPEIVGIALGAFLMALFTRRLNLKGGSSPTIRFVLGVFMGILGLVFLGCTLRMILRMAAGDLSGYVGFIGFVLGSWVGLWFLKNGFTLGEGTEIAKGDSFAFPATLLALFILFLAVPSLFIFSEEGPGSMHAPIFLSLVVGLLFGAVSQRTNLCMSGATRSILSVGDFKGAMPILGIFLTMLIYNIATGSFSFQAYGPIAHSQNLWNILSMFGIGVASALAGGCPVRQLIKASSGNGDGFITTIGILLGVAMSHNFGLASAAASPESAGGPSGAGKVAVILAIVIILIIGFWGVNRSKVGEASHAEKAIQEG